MIDFLIKSSLSLGVLLIAYYLFLEKEKIHVFNRFYLLFSILFSFAIPFVTIEIIQEIPRQEIPLNNFPTGAITSIPILEDSTNYWLVAAWSFYGIVTLVLLTRFVLNILKLNDRTKSNPIIDYKNAKLVLLKEKTLPYTFLNHIFINETDYQDRKIEAELYTHELIHVTQKHTLDVLFIEILKVLFWFNPLFIFYKKAIQLNHEFLADEKVVNSHNNVPFYQNLLLSKANENPTYYLASNLNYSVTKKRLIMMTKTTSATRALLKKGLLIPLLTALIFSLCTKVVAQEKKATNSNKKNNEIAKKTDPLSVNTSVKTVTGFFLIPETYALQEVDVKPEFSGGINMLNTSITQNFVFPKDCSEVKLQIGFVVETDGSLSNFSPINDNCPGSNDEVIRVLKNLPKWKPGTKNGKAVRTSYNLPVIIIVNPKKSKTKQKKPNTIYNTSQLTEKPEFVGGMENFYKFVGENYKTPKTLDDLKLAGKVYVTYIIEANGEISNIKVLRDIGYGTGEEAIRVLQLSPKWNPGTINGEAVRTLYSLPISIQSKS